MGHALGLGMEVIAFDDLTTGSMANLQSQSNNPRFTFVKGDIMRSAALAPILERADGVVHLAAVVSIQKSLESPGLVHRVNVGGTLNVLEASAKAGVKSIVFASSAAVYGDTAAPPFKERVALSPISLYGATKAAGESYCSAYGKSFDIKVTVLRFANVYGRRRRLGPYGNVMVRFAEAISKGEPLTIFGDGTQTRDFVHVTDVVSVIGAVAAGEGNGGIFNIGSGVQTQIGRLANIFAGRTPSGKWPLRYLESRRGDISRSYLDIGKARRQLGYRPRVGLRQGVSDFVDWYRNEDLASKT